MANDSLGLNEPLTAYLRDVGIRETPIAKRLREDTFARIEMHRMQISPEQGAFMANLVRMTGAKRILEIGTFTGYSALWMAGALPDDGELTACDISEEWTSFAQSYWKEAGIDHKISLRLGPALKTLEELMAAGQENQYDVAFIDADKENYRPYYEACLQLVRPGGVIVIDNVLWGGKVLEEDGDVDTCAIQDLNRFLKEDSRIHLSMTPIGDGLTLCITKS